MITINDKEFDRLKTYMYKNFGIDLSKKRQLIEGRLSNVIVQHGFSNFTEYIDYVMGDGGATEVEQLLNRLTTNHTYFMRESAHFDLFKNIILPKLEKTKARSKSIGIWSAGCSSGEEPYTLSMILKDYFETKPGWDTRVLATDISQKAMSAAKEATYRTENLKDIPKEWSRKYFKYNGETATLNQVIRDNVIFRTFNLMSPIQFKVKFDVIFCRNVMIYFDKETKLALIRRFYDATAPGGYLLVGHSETLTTGEHPYKNLSNAAYVKE